MNLDLQYNYIIFGVVINAMALFNLLKNNFELFVGLFIFSNLIDLYLIDNTYKKLKQRAQWFKLITTLTVFRKKYKNIIKFDHIVFFIIIFISSSFNGIQKKKITLLNDPFIVSYIVLLMSFVNYYKN